MSWGIKGPQVPRILAVLTIGFVCIKGQIWLRFCSAISLLAQLTKLQLGHVWFWSGTLDLLHITCNFYYFLFYPNKKVETYFIPSPFEMPAQIGCI